MASHTACCGINFWIYILVIFGLVCFAGMMSGLTLGLMSLGLMDLEVLKQSGTEADRKHAAKILPVVKNQHLLLCTLLIGNALAMEALPIFLDTLVPAWAAILVSVTLILMFGEIFPQAVCTRYGLAVGSFLAPVVRVLVMFFFPVSYPISKLLDKMLGKGHVALFRRAELKTLVSMHANEAGKGGELTHDETTIIAGALELTEKTATQAMTSVAEIFSIDINAKLDINLMNLIMEKGHSRIPVHSGSPANIIGLILVKNLLKIRAQDEVPVRNLTIRKIPRVPDTMPLYDILNEFQKGQSHMAVVVKYTKEKTDSMLRREGSKGDRRLSARRHSKRASDAKGGGSYKFASLDIPEGEIPPSETGSPQRDATADNGPVTSNLPNPTKQTVTNQNVSPIMDGASDGRPLVGPPGPLVSQKSRKFKMPEAAIDISSDTVIKPPQDEEVVGIITMEDLIEELLQEEIWDETDEYIDIHNKIKVNLMPAGASNPSSSIPLATAKSLPSSSIALATAKSMPKNTAPTSPRVSLTPQASIGSPLRTAGPGSPLVELKTAGAHHPKLKSALLDNPPLESPVEEEKTI